MKKWMRTVIFTVSAAVLLCGSAFAADAIEVQVNDEPIVFTDAQPEAKDGRTFIPMRATFNAIGFKDEDIVWNGATSTVTASRGDLTISLKLGEKNITITEAGETRKVDIDVAAYAANNRTYVPVRFVAEAAGCNVGWDSTDRIVLIDDVDALLAANTETYELMNQYLDYGRKYSEGNIAMKGDLGMSMEMSDVMFIAMGGEFNALSNQTAIEMDMDMEMILDVAVPDENGVMTSVQQTQALSVKACGDMGNGVLYYKSDELTGMMGAEGEVWFKMDMNAIMSMEGMDELIGMDYSELLQLSKDSMNMSFEDTIAAVLKLIPLTDDAATAKEVLAVINTLCADSAFTKDGSDYVSVVDMEGATLEMVFHTSGGKVNGYSIGLSVEGQEILVMTMQGNEVVMIMQYVDDANGVGLEMTLGATYNKSSKGPVTEPPTEAVIIDLFNLMNVVDDEVISETVIEMEPVA